MDIIFELANLKEIKKTFDKTFSTFSEQLQKSSEFKCFFIRIINEVLLIKACIDHGIIESTSIQNTEQLLKTKKKLASYNPCLKMIFKIGEKYSFDFSDDVVLTLKNEMFKYSFKDIDFDFTGKIYQKYLGSSDKKKFGQYYTDETIINEILDKLSIDKDNKNLMTSKYLDPACGTGSFLIRLARRIILGGEEKNLSPKEIAESIENIYGLDINDFAVYIAKSNIIIQLIPMIAKDKTLCPKINVFTTNTLDNLVEDHDYYEDPTVIHIKQGKQKYKNGFDYIVGNPPYFKVKSLSISQKRYFKKILIGQQNMFSLFFFLGINLLSDGGKIGLIIPESIKSGQYFRALREYLFSKCTITNLVSFDCRKTNFIDALQGVLIICAYKGISNNSKYIEIKNVTNKDGLQDIVNAPFSANYTDVVRYIKGYPLLLLCKHLEDYKAFNQIYKDCTYLDAEEVGFTAKTGKLVWNQVKQFLTDDIGEDNKNIVWSNNIEQYKCSLTGDKNNKNKYAVRTKKLLSLSNIGECLVLRRTSVKEQNKRIIASSLRVNDYFFIENHVNYLIKVGGNPNISYNYILALLNSKTFNFVMSQIAGNNQISVTEINLLPIKFSDKTELISRYVELINSGDCNKELIRLQIEDLIMNTYFKDSITQTNLFRSE